MRYSGKRGEKSERKGWEKERERGMVWMRNIGRILYLEYKLVF